MAQTLDVADALLVREGAMAGIPKAGVRAWMRDKAGLPPIVTEADQQNGLEDMMDGMTMDDLLAASDTVEAGE